MPDRKLSPAFRLQLRWVWLLLGLSLWPALTGCEYASPFEAVACQSDDDCGQGAICAEGYCVDDGLADRPELASLQVVPSTVSLAPGQTSRLEVTGRDADGQPVELGAVHWATGDPAVATVEDGVVTATGRGTTLITAVSGGRQAAAAVSVEPLPPVEVAIAPEQATLTVGQTQVFEASVFDADGAQIAQAPVVWQSSDSQVAVVDAAGRALALSAGTTTITATSGQASAEATLTVEATPVATVELSPTSADLELGAQLQLEAVARDDQGRRLDDRPIAWQAADDTVATVDADGLVTAVSLGTTEVSATIGSQVGTATITVVPEGVGAVAVSPLAATVEAGRTVDLSATVTSTGGANLDSRTVQWTSSDDQVASVDAGGTVTGVARGTALITATVGDHAASAAVTVVRPQVTDLSISPTTATLELDQTVQLDATATDAAGDPVAGPAVVWTSADTSVARVDSTGVVLGVGLGQTTITATSDGATATATVDVVARPVATVALSPQSATLEEGQTLMLDAVARAASGERLEGRTITFSSSDPAVATVDASGLVTAVGAGGPATITASAGTSVSASATIQVVARSVARVAIDPPATTVSAGQTVGLSVTAFAADGSTLATTGRTISWASADGTVASVDPTGQVTAIAPGLALITASVDGVEATASVAVEPRPVDQVTLAPATSTISAGSTLQLTAELTAADGTILAGRPIAWASTDASVATVDSTGLVFGLAAGTATITATSEGIQAQATITVDPRAVDRLLLSPTQAAIAVYETVQLEATALSVDDVVLTRTLVWQSSDSTIADVDDTGLVTGIAAGQATITVTAEGQIQTATITVAQPPVDTVALSPASVAIVEGEAAQLSATALDALGTPIAGKTVHWSSADTAVAQVDQAGQVIGVSPGSTNIVANIDGVIAEAPVVVDPVPVATVDVTPDAPSLDVGRTVALAATLYDGSGNALTGRTVAWSSATPGVATVDADGVVSAVAEGTATVTASEPGGQTGSETVTATWRFQGASGGASHTCATTTHGNATCFGSNAQAQLGDQTVVDRSRPVFVDSPLSLSGLAAGLFHTCGIDATGAAYCWGNNLEGQLGDASTADSREPVPVATARTFSALAAGDFHACGLGDDQQIYCWGSGEFGQLGDGQSGAGYRQTSPVVVGLDYANWTPTALSAGADFACALATSTADATDQRAFCWGRNADGQLGDGSTADAPQPVEVGFDYTQQTPTALSAGAAHACAIAADSGGQLAAWCWGDNQYGQLGDASTSDRTQPVAVAGGVALESAAAGGQHSCGIDDTGAGWCWGRNDHGQLGNADPGVDQSQPVAVSTTATFGAMVAGGSHSCAVDDVDQLWCWGDNAAGQLGDASTTQRATPVLVTTPQ